MFGSIRWQLCIDGMDTAKYNRKTRYCETVTLVTVPYHVFIGLCIWTVKKNYATK